MVYEIVLPLFPLGIGFLLGTAIKQVAEMIWSTYFQAKQTVTQVFSTALMIRDSGILMVQESYETALMLARNILDGVLMPIVNATKELILLIKPVLDLVVVVMKTLIMVIRQAAELIQVIVQSTSALLTSIFGAIYSFATNTSATVSSWTSWMYKGSSDTFFYTLLYVFGFYVFAHVAILVTKRLVKKIK
jgi:hypothetical protein